MVLLEINGPEKKTLHLQTAKGVDNTYVKSIKASVIVTEF